MTPAARALACGELHVLGRLADASNLALLAEVTTEGTPLRCIYKPVAGEQPLWDFPGTALAAREVLTARAAACFQWDLIPETAWRDDGPVGPGMCQEWVQSTEDAPVQLMLPSDVPVGWSEIAAGHDATGEVIVLAHAPDMPLQRLVVLDALVNNADRKGGHILRKPDGELAAIDHGVTFHAEDKLRTVLWGWAGQPIPEGILTELHAGAAAFRDLMRSAEADPMLPGDTLPAESQHTSRSVDAASARASARAGCSPGPGERRLDGNEVRAALARLDRLLSTATFPIPGEDRPALPWPPL